MNRPDQEVHARMSLRPAVALLVAAALAPAAALGASAGLKGTFTKRYQGKQVALVLAGRSDRVVVDGKVGVVGAYQVQGRFITFQAEQGPLGCGTRPGKYRWTLSGRKLVFKLVRDSCQGRKAMLTSGPFKKQ
jgi:hypothetical protein